MQNKEFIKTTKVILLVAIDEFRKFVPEERETKTLVPALRHGFQLNILTQGIIMNMFSFRGDHNHLVDRIMNLTL